MRQPFNQAAAEIKTFDELVDLDTPWFTVFETRRDGMAQAYISVAGRFQRAEEITGEIVAKEHTSLEDALFQTSAYRKARDTSGKLVFTNVNISHDALVTFMAHPLLPEFLNPRKIPEEAFPEFTDIRMVLKQLCRRTGITLNLWHPCKTHAAEFWDCCWAGPPPRSSRAMFPRRAPVIIPPIS